MENLRGIAYNFGKVQNGTLRRYIIHTILLVEDEALIARAEKDTIERAGYSVLTAGSGEKAIKYLEDGTAIDLVLMDINLGDGIDGPEAARRILNRWSVPIVFLTSHSEREFVERVREISCYGYGIKQ